MKKLLFIFLLLLQACAASMSPSEFIEEFPKATKTTYIDKASLKDMANCRVLVEDRKYVAPMGLTVQGDVNNGAIGVDEWVTTDKGNAYTINNFEWVTVAVRNESATQLIIYFNSLLCK